MVSVNSAFGGGRNSFIKWGKFLIAAALILSSGFFVFADTALADGLITVTAISPVNVSTDAVSGASASVGNITMAESDSGNFGTGTVILNAPTGFVFDTTSDVSITIHGDSSAGNNINNKADGSVVNVTPLSNSITFTITEKSASGHPNILVWSGIKVKPTSGSPLVNGYITISGTASSTTYSTTSPVLLVEVAGSPDAAHSTFTCLPTTVQAGTGTSCTANVKDAFNNPISGASVSLIASGTNTNFDHNPTLTEPTGQATFQVTSTQAQTETITATINGSVSLTPVSVTFIAAGAATGTIHADTTTPEASLAPGTPVVLTITVTDSYGNPVNNYPVDIRVNFVPHIPGLGSASITGSGVTQGNGQTTRTLTGINVGTATLNFNGLTAAGDTTIHFVDTTKPVITVLGDNPATVEFRTSYSDAGATATDNIDGTVSVTSSSSVDTYTINQTPPFTNKIVGVYHVTYTATDSSGNTQTATRTVNVVDTTKPVITSITSDATSSGVLKIGGTITFTLTTQQDEPDGWSINGSYNGQALSWARGTENHTFVATYSVTEGDPDQTTPLQIAGVTMTDETGNVSEPASGSDVAKTIDAHRPTVVSVDSDGKTFNLSTSSPQTIKITFNEEISVAPTVKVASSSQAVGNCSDSDAKTFCFDYTIPSSTDRTTMTIDISGAKDLAGNEMISNNSHTFIVDTVAPVLTEETPVPTPTNDNTPSYTFSSTEAGTITYAGSCGNGNLSSAGVGDNNMTTYGPLADGTYNNCTIVVTDMAGNPSKPLTVNPFTVDTVHPTVTISSSAPNPTNTSPIHVTATFSENVTGFELGDITVGNGAAGNFVAVDGKTYTFDVTPNGNGQVTVDIAAGVAQDAAGNGNTTGTFSIVYDTTPPTVTSVQLKEGTNVSDGLVKAGDVLTINVTFSEDMAETPSPTIAISGAGQNLTATDMIRVDATHYTYNFTVGSGNGTATITIANGRDLAGNTQVVNSSTTFTVDNTKPVIDQHDPIIDVANATGGKIITYTVTASDTHDSAIIPTCVPSSGSFFLVSQTTTVTCNATDQAGNAAKPMTFNVTVNPDVITHIVLTASPTSLAFDKTSVITITGKDQWENVVTNNNSTVVVLSADGGGSLADTILTLSSGTKYTNLSKDSVGTVHVTASSDGLTPQSVTVTFTETDISGPFVQEAFPINGATGVPVNVQPYLIFSEPLKPSTVTSETVQLKKVGGEVVPAIVSLDFMEGRQRVKITPASNLDFNTQYYFVVTSGVTDEVGNAATPLEGGYEFTTEKLEGIIKDDITLPSIGIADNKYLDGWHYIFKITVNNPAETELFVWFGDWKNTDNPEEFVETLGNVRLLLNAGAGVGLTEADIEKGFSLGNDYNNQTPGPVDISGTDNNPDRAGRQVQFDVFVKLPETTAPGFYTTNFGIQSLVPTGGEGGGGEGGGGSIPDTTPPGILSYTFNGTAGNITVNPTISNPVQINLTASENVNWIRITIENVDSPNNYKYFSPGSSCDGKANCTESWNGSMSQGTLVDGNYRIKVHIKDAADNDFQDYLAPYLITVDTTL
jgi:hypothetical protein